MNEFSNDLNKNEENNFSSLNIFNDGNEMKTNQKLKKLNSKKYGTEKVLKKSQKFRIKLVNNKKTDLSNCLDHFEGHFKNYSEMKSSIVELTIDQDNYIKDEISLDNESGLDLFIDNCNEKHDTLRSNLDYNDSLSIDSDGFSFVNIVHNNNVNIDLDDVNNYTDLKLDTNKIKESNPIEFKIDKDRNDKIEQYEKLDDLNSNCFLFKDSDYANEEILIRSKNLRNPINSQMNNQDHQIINNIMLSDQSNDYLFQTEFNRTDFDLDNEKNSFSYSEIEFNCNDLNDNMELDKKIDDEKSIERQTLNQTNCSTTFQENFCKENFCKENFCKENYRENYNTNPIINSNLINSSNFLSVLPTTCFYSNDSTDQNSNLESSNIENSNIKILNTENNIKTSIVEPNSKESPFNESKNANNLNIIESDHIMVDNLQLNETLLNALLSNHQLNNGKSNLNMICKNKQASSSLNSICSNKHSLNGYLITQSTLNDQTTNETNDYFDKLNSVNLKLSSNLIDNKSNQSNFRIATNTNLLISNEIETEQVTLFNLTDSENLKSSNLVNCNLNDEQTTEKRLISDEQIIQLTNSLSKSSDCLNSLYSLANNLNQFSSTMINHQTLTSIKTIDQNLDQNFTNLNNENLKKNNNPFSIDCRIPLPGELINDQNLYTDNKNFIKRRNQRERIRVKSVNDGFEKLRKHLPVDYEQYLDQTNYCLNNSNNSTYSTNETVDFKNCKLYSSECTDKFLDKKPINYQFNEQNSNNYSNSSSSSTTSSTSNKDKRLSKVETLRLAINYIKHLENILNSS